MLFMDDKDRKSNPYSSMLGMASFKPFSDTSPTIPFVKDMSVEGFYNNWINSEEYRNRLAQNEYESPDQMVRNRSNSIQNSIFEMNESNPTMANAPATPTSKSYININPQDIGTQASFDTLKAHEASHVAGAKQQFQNPVVGFNEKEAGIIRDLTTNKSKNSHDRAPEEIKADLDATRYNLFKKGIYDISEGKPFTKKELDKAMPFLKKDTSFNRLFEQTGEDNFIEMMNTIAKGGKQEGVKA